MIGEYFKNIIEEEINDYQLICTVLEFNEETQQVKIKYTDGYIGWWNIGIFKSEWKHVPGYGTPLYKVINS